MITKKEVTKLLSRSLTGWEAGLLAFEDSWVGNRGQEPLLGDADITALTDGLTNPEETRDYNTLIRLYRVADFIERQALALVAKVSYSLENLAGQAQVVALTLGARQKLRSLPLVVTQKQFNELKVKQRKMLLSRFYCLDEVISMRAHAEAPAELRKGSEPDAIQNHSPELYDKAEIRVQALIEADQLQPVRFATPASSLPLHRSAPADPDLNRWPGWEWIPEEDHWTPEQSEHYLQFYIQGEQLYKAGLSEWREEIDTFKPYLLEKCPRRLRREPFLPK